MKKKYRPDFDFIIIDCSPVNYMDIMGIKTLIQVRAIERLSISDRKWICRSSKITKKLVLPSCSRTFDVSEECSLHHLPRSFLAIVYQHLQRMSYMDVAGRETIHVTINDAVLHALKTVRTREILLALIERSRCSSGSRVTRWCTHPVIQRLTWASRMLLTLRIVLTMTKPSSEVTCNRFTFLPT